MGPAVIASRVQFCFAVFSSLLIESPVSWTYFRFLSLNM